MVFDLKELLPAIGSIFSALAAALSSWVLWQFRTITKENKALKKALEEVREQDLKGKVTEVKNEVSDVKSKLETHIKEEKPEMQSAKLKELGETVAKHIENDRSQEILNELKHLSGSVTHMVDKIDQINRNDAEQKANIKNHDLYLKNLNDLVTSHINNHKK